MTGLARVSTAFLHVTEYLSLTIAQQIPMNHHNHRHTTMSVKSPGRDLGMLGVFIHVLGDAINNIGVIIAAVLVWQLKGEGRYYADPAVGVFISLMILLSAIPLLKKSGAILLQTAPKGVNPEDVKNDIEMVTAYSSFCSEPRLTRISDPWHQIGARAAHLAPGPTQICRLCTHRRRQ